LPQYCMIDLGEYEMTAYAGRVRPLTLGQQQRLARAAQAGDKRAGAKLVESCIGLVATVAKEEGSGPIVREMVQNGVLEMLERLYGRPNKRNPEQTVARYDPERGVKFWTFVKPYVLAAVRDTFEAKHKRVRKSEKDDRVEPDTSIESLMNEWTLAAYREARTAVNELPEPDRSLCILKYGLGHWGEKSRAETAWLIGVSDRHAQTALQRAGRKLRRDDRVRALKGLLGYESKKDYEELQERSQRLSEAPAAPPRPVVPYQGRPALDIDMFPGLRVRPVRVWRGTPSEAPRQRRTWEPPATPELPVLRFARETTEHDKTYAREIWVYRYIKKFGAEPLWKTRPRGEMRWRTVKIVEVPWQDAVRRTEEAVKLALEEIREDRKEVVSQGVGEPIVLVKEETEPPPHAA
jgi:RNA polymerase sigma factor (sigma-70 family)